MPLKKIIKILFICLIAISYSFLVNAQPNKHSIETKDQIRDSLRKYFAPKFLYRKDVLDIIHNIIDKSRELQYDSGLMVSYNLLAQFYHGKQINDTAAFYYKKTLETKNIDDFVEFKGKLYENLASSLWAMGNFSEALEFALEAKKYYENYEDINKEFYLYNLLGLIYRSLNDFNLSLYYFDLALMSARDAGNEAFEGIVYSNIGNLYYNNGKIDQALEFFNKGLKIEEKYNQTNAAGRSYTVLAQIHLDLKLYNAARQLLRNAINYNTEAKDKLGILRTYNTLARLNVVEKNYDTAEYYLLQSIQIAAEIGADKELFEAYQLLSESHEKKGNYQTAYQYYLLYDSIYKSIFDIKKLANLKQIEHNLNLERKENELNQLQIEKEKSKNRFLIIILLLSIIIMSLFLVLYIFTVRSKDRLIKKNQEIESQKNRLELLNQELKNAKKRAEESDLLKSHFLRNISHEIRTPLNGITGISKIILNENLDSKSKKDYYNLIIANSNDLISTIDNIVDMANISSNQINTSFQSFQILPFIDSIIQFAEQRIIMAEDKSIVIKKDTPDLTELTITTDKKLLQKIIIQLINNAIKFANKGEIVLGLSVLNKSFEFYVKDSGIGIPEDKQNMVFSPFRQANEKMNREFGGSGLGLSIAKNIVELLGGKIWLKSSLNMGTTVFFTIPKNNA